LTNDYLESLFKTKLRDEWVNKSIDFDVCLSPVLDTRSMTKKTKKRAPVQDVTIDDQTIKTYTKPIKAIQVCKFFCV
jgi:crotonobetainyl-CoA:carnitine CoA-transferase CaiB-like acyl-CoA transferase